MTAAHCTYDYSSQKEENEEDDPSQFMAFFERLYNTYLKVTIHELLMRKIRESTF